MHSLYLNEYKVGCKLLSKPFKMVITFEIQNISQAEKFYRIQWGISDGTHESIVNASLNFKRLI